MSSFMGVLVSDQWLQSQFTQVELRSLKSKFISLRNQNGKVTMGDLPPLMVNLKAFSQIFKVEEIRAILGESGYAMDDEIDFEGFLKSYLNLQSRATAKLGGQKNSSSFLKATTTTLLHTISESEKSSYVAHINSYLRDDPFLKQFLPIDPSSNALFDLAKDGVLLCKLINVAVPGTIDERAINTKRVLNPWERNENHTLCLNSAKAIGCTVVNIGTQDLVEGRPHLVLGLISQIIKIQLLADLNLRKTPQLVELVDDNNDVEELMGLAPEKVLLKWMNFHLKKAGYKKTVTNFSSDLKDGEAYAYLLNVLAPEHCSPATLDAKEPAERANLVLDHAEKMDCKRYLTPKDIVEGSTNLNLAFVAQIFHQRNGLSTDSKKVSFAEMMTDDEQMSREERCFRLWINSLGIATYVNNLFEDVRNGWILLEVLEKISPGSVIWKQATKPPIKMPFRKVENCNQVIRIGKQLKLSLVNVAGNDIVQGNKKLIVAFLWQLMRFNVLQLLKNLRSHSQGKEITDADILIWANKKVKSTGRTSNIESFKDKSLSSGLFFLELLSAVEPRVVREESPTVTTSSSSSVLEAANGPEKAEAAGGGGGEEEVAEKAEDPMEEDAVNPATVFCIRLKQPRSNLMHKMSVPELCRNFSAVAWCGKLNAIACASETCARIPSSNANPPFWIPIHIVIPERPTECAVFNVIADSPRDSVQFMEWSPTSCHRALLIANFHGRITIWTQPSQGLPNLVRDASCWQREHEWRQDIAVVTKWLSGVPPYRWLSSRSSSSANSTFEEKFLSQQPQAPAGWPNFLCVCSVFSSGSVQLHWSQWPPNQSGAASKWFCTSKGLLGAGPSGIMAADAIITDAGAMHVAGVPIVNPSTVVVWEVTPGPGNGFQATPKASTSTGVPPSLNPPSWDGFAPLAAYLFSWQEYFLLEAKQGKKHSDQDYSDMVSLHCSPVSNFSAYVSPEAAAQTAATTTWGSGVTAVAFDPTRGGSVIAVVIVEGQYMSPYDPDEGPSITGWRVQRWESSLKPVVLHQIFGNPTSSFGGQAPMQTVWVTTVNKCIPPTSDFKIHQAADVRNTSDTGIEKTKRVCFDPFDLPSDVRTLARIVYSAHGGEIAVAFLRGGVHIFSGASFAPVDNYQINVGSTIAAPAFSSTSCCSASVWHDTSKDCTMLKIIRVLPPAVPSSQVKANSSTWERAIAERFWWSLLVGVDWWDAVGCTQSAAEDGIVSLNSVIAVLDADFHSLPSTQHRQQYGPSLDRIKCRLLEGTNAQEVRAMVLDMQARLLLDMLGKGIESALINPSALVSEPWQESGEKLSSIDPESMAVEPALVLSIQAYVDAVLDLASHFITRLRRYASFCRTLATHAVTAGTGGNRSMVASPTQTSNPPATSQGGQGGTATSTGSTQMQAWVQGAIAKISSTADGVPSSTPNPTSGPSSFMPISINTGTFPGTPAVRLIGDCHFLHRLCQLLLFCFFFRRTQLPRFIGAAQRNTDANMQKPQPGATAKVEEVNSLPAKPSAEMQAARAGQVIPGAKGSEEGPANRSRLGSGNAGQGYTFEEVKVLFLILMDLCRRTSGLAHPLPVSQVGSSNIQVRLHYIDGNYTVLPEVVEASLGPHMQNMPRPRGADAAGLLLRELELHPPAEEWHRRNMYGGPWSDPEDMGPADDPSKLSISADPLKLNSLEGIYNGANVLWPRKRRMSERDAAFGLNTSVGLGAYLGIMGSRRDVVTAVWKTGLEGVWYKCIRCLRQTSAFASPGSSNSPNQNEREMWWISRWAYGCPMCGGTWVRVV